jgi:hypothetical protein
MRRAILTAALALAAVFPTAAGAGGFGTTVIIDGGCDVFDVSVDSHNVATIQEVSSTRCGTKYGVGVVGTSLAHHLGSAMLFSLHDAANPDKVGILELSYPLEVGGTWAAYSTADGGSYNLVGSGTYHNTK